MNYFQHVTPYQGTDKITICNGEGLPIQHIGSAKLHSMPNSLILRTVLHVPTTTVSLMSVQLCKDNFCWFICDDHEFFVHDKVTKDVLYQGMSNEGELFQIPAQLLSGSSTSSSRKSMALLGQKVKTAIWHQRLGYPNNEILSIMLKQSNIICSPDEQQHLCAHCISGKMSRLPFYDKTETCTFPFQKVHSDLWGQ